MGFIRDLGIFFLDLSFVRHLIFVVEDDHGLGGTGDNLKWPVLHVALHQRVQESATNEALGVENGVLLVQCGCLTTHPRNCR